MLGIQIFKNLFRSLFVNFYFTCLPYLNGRLLSKVTIVWNIVSKLGLQLVLRTLCFLYKGRKMVGI